METTPNQQPANRSISSMGIRIETTDDLNGDHLVQLARYIANAKIDLMEVLHNV